MKIHVDLVNDSGVRLGAGLHPPASITGISWPSPPGYAPRHSALRLRDRKAAGSFLLKYFYTITPAFVKWQLTNVHFTRATMYFSHFSRAARFSTAR